MSSENTEFKRLNKFISETGFCSRREADKLIDQGRVTVNGEPAQLGIKVTNSCTILVDGLPVNKKEKTVYLAFNKPVGITCTTELKVDDNIINYIGYKKRIFPIGRLDKPSSGLIFLTNDGDIVNKILRAGNNHEKEYIVTVNKPITHQFLERMANGMPILDTITKKCTVTSESKTTFRIILTQGLNRQIRRMCEALGYAVIKLNRTRIMNITLKGLKVGKWRYLTPKEITEIQNRVATSGKTEEASIFDDEE